MIGCGVICINIQQFQTYRVSLGEQVSFIKSVACFSFPIFFLSLLPHLLLTLDGEWISRCPCGYAQAPFGGHKLSFSIFLNCSHLIFEVKVLSLNLGFNNSTRLDVQQAPKITLSLTPPALALYTCNTIIPGLSTGAGNLNSSSHLCVASFLLIELSPYHGSFIYISKSFNVQTFLI